MSEAPIELVTAPTAGTYAVSLARVKSHCRVDIEEDNALFLDLITAATEFFESQIYGRRQILQATYDLRLSDWFDCHELPNPPLSSVTSVKYQDVTDTQQTLATSYYTVYVPQRQPGRIEMDPDLSLPSLYSTSNWPVVVRFVAGYTAANVPAKIKQAILFIVDHWYNQRGAVVVGTISKELEFTLSSLAESEGWGSYR